MHEAIRLLNKEKLLLLDQIRQGDAKIDMCKKDMEGIKAAQETARDAIEHLDKAIAKLETK